MAAPSDPEAPVSIRAFGTLGLAHNSTDQAEFVRDFLQPEGVGNAWSGNVDSRLGVQVNARPTQAIEAVIQATSSYNYAGSYRPELTWAFVSYSPSADFKARIGRLGWDVYMISDTRNVGYSYLWVRPPVDYFGPLQISHIDGADVVVKHELGGGLISGKVYMGWANQRVPTPLGDDIDLAGSRVSGVNLGFRKGDWQLHAGYTAARIKKEVPGVGPLLAALHGTGFPGALQLADDVAFAGKSIHLASIGAVFDRGPWQSQLMFSRNRSTSLVWPTKTSGYFLLGYRTGQWTPFLSLSRTRSRTVQRATGLPTPNPLDDAVAVTLASSQSRQHTTSLGVRYDFMRNLDLKLQVDRIQVQDHAALLWRNAQPGWNGRATVVSLTLDFAF
ncbi:MAG: hypothetical protein ABIQ50_11200 [Usitatibacter sp.]